MPTYTDCPLCGTSPEYHLDSGPVIYHGFRCPRCYAYFQSGEVPDGLTSAEYRMLDKFAHGSWSQTSKSAALSGWRNMVRRYLAKKEQAAAAEAAKTPIQRALDSLKKDVGPISSAASSWLFGLLNLIDGLRSTKDQRRLEQQLAAVRAYVRLD